MTQRLVVGQSIVHRRYGAGTVVRVRKGRDDEECDHYYVIDIPSRDLKVHLPADAGEELNLRQPASPKAIQGAIEALAADAEELPRDYRERRAQIAASLDEGTVLILAEVIRDLVGLKDRKALSTLESTWLTNAKRRLAGEIALVMDLALDDAAQRIEHALHRIPA